MANILIIDDDPDFCRVLSTKLKNMAHDVSCAFTMLEGIRASEKESFDVVYLDVHLPDGSGLDALPAIMKASSEPEVIIMTGWGDPDGAELSIKSGAWDYIQKPSSLNAMVLPLIRALQYRDIKGTNRRELALKRHGIIGQSPQMTACLVRIAEAADTDANVLIRGETGTGKELAAWAIHKNSRRGHRSFVVLDCASLTETLVESMLFGYEKGAYTGADQAKTGLILQADGGTLFLDEVGELPFSIQRAFLRVLQERRFRPLGAKRELESDFRLMAATNRDLDAMVREGTFRGDLLYRLRSITLEMPPLRDRAKDIGELAIHYVKKICERYGKEIKGLSPDIYDMLCLYDWPGNVRELINTLERAVAVARQESTLIPQHLPEDIRIRALRSSIRQAESDNSETAPPVSGELASWPMYREAALGRVAQEYLQELLKRAGDDTKKACEISGFSRSRFYAFLKKHRNH